MEKLLVNILMVEWIYFYAFNVLFQMFNYLTLKIFFLLILLIENVKM